MQLSPVISKLILGLAISAVAYQIYNTYTQTGEINRLQIGIILVGILIVLFRILKSEDRIDAVMEDIEAAHPSLNRDLVYEDIRVKDGLSKMKFSCGDQEVGYYKDDLVSNGQTYAITDRSEYVTLLLHNGVILASSTLQKPDLTTAILTFGSDGYVLSSTVSGQFPFSIHKNGHGIGIINTNSIYLPRNIPVEARMFAYIIAYCINQDASPQYTEYNDASITIRI